MTNSVESGGSKPLSRSVLSCVGLCAAASAVYGFWLAWEPLGYIVGGVLGILGVARILQREAEAELPPIED